MIRLHSIAGDGVLGRYGDLVVLTSAPAGSEDLVDEVIRTLEQTARGGDGNALADRLGELVPGTGLDLVAFGPAAGSVTVSVFGRAWIAVVTEHGEQRLALRQSTDKVRTIAPGAVRSLRAGLGHLDTDTPAQRWSDLGMGVTRAGALVLAVADDVEVATTTDTSVASATLPAAEPAGRPAAPRAAEPSPAPVPEPAPVDESRTTLPGRAEPLPAPPPEPLLPPPGPASEPTVAHPMPAPPPPEAQAPERQAPAHQAPEHQAPEHQPSEPQAPAPQAPAPQAPAPQPAAAFATPQPSAAPPPVDDPGRDGRAGPPELPAVAAPGISVDRSQPFEAVSLLAQAAPSVLDDRAPLPVVTKPDAPPIADAPLPSHPVADEAVEIMGVYCKNGHFDDPAARYCAVCGISMAQQTLIPRRGPRPPLGVLVLDDGSIYTLDTDYIIGRDPSRDPDVVAGSARPLRIDDPEGLLSRVHARIHLEGWNVELIDLGSANGTGIWGPHDTVWQRAPVQTPAVVRPGTQIGVGRRQMRYESHRNT